jgi:capsid protein
MSSAKSDGPRLNFLERSICAIAPTWGFRRAVSREYMTMLGYDGAGPSTRRGSSGGLQKNASSESSRMNDDRIEMMWDARDLVRNMPVLSCALKRTVQYVCSRLVYRPRTGDPEIDLSYQLWLDEWMENYADVTSRHDFRLLTEMALGMALVDGDFGAVPFMDGRMAQVQCVEADRIGDPNQRGSNMLRDDYVHGIWLDERGRPISYDIYKRSKQARYELDQQVEAERFIHLWFPGMSDEYRGRTWFANVRTAARDLYEMFAFERLAAKWAAAIAGVTKSTDSRMGPGTADAAAVWGEIKENADSQPSYKVQPGSLLRLKPNEEVTPFQPANRPSGAFLAYIDSELRNIAMGLNVPFGFFDMREFNGVVSRLEAQQCQRTFQKFQVGLVAKWLNPWRKLALASGIALRRIKAHPNWLAGKWQFGAHITADVGYQTQANIALMKAGLKTGSEITEEEGEDFEEVTRRLAEEAEYTYAQSVEKQIPIELIAPDRFVNATQLLSTVNAAAEPPEPAEPTIETVGETGAAKLGELLEQVSTGLIPREQAINLLVHVWQMDPAKAQAIVPQPNARAMRQSKPASTGPSARKPKKGADD